MKFIHWSGLSREDELEITRLLATSLEILVANLSHILGALATNWLHFIKTA